MPKTKRTPPPSPLKGINTCETHLASTSISKVAQQIGVTLRSKKLRPYESNPPKSELDEIKYTLQTVLQDQD